VHQLRNQTPIFSELSGLLQKKDEGPADPTFAHAAINLTKSKYFFPFPTSETMATEKNALTCFGAWTGKKFQILSGSVFCNQSQRKLRAQLSCCRFEMLRPPSLIDLVTLGQAMRQCPPLSSFRPFHKNPLLHLSIAFNAHGGRFKAISK